MILCGPRRCDRCIPINRQIRANSFNGRTGRVDRYHQAVSPRLIQVASASTDRRKRPGRDQIGWKLHRPRTGGPGFSSSQWFWQSRHCLVSWPWLNPLRSPIRASRRHRPERTHLNYRVPTRLALPRPSRVRHYRPPASGEKLSWRGGFANWSGWSSRCPDRWGRGAVDRRPTSVPFPPR